MANIREVYRAGWLKKITSDDRKKTFKNPCVEKVWLVFCIHDDRFPFLEQYKNRTMAASHLPLFAYPLTECFHISASIRPTVDDEHEFVVTLKQDVVKFSSPKREVAAEWISILRNQLRELHVLEAASNVYSKTPRQPLPFGLQRDPNSPLPAPPARPPVLDTTLLTAADAGMSMPPTSYLAENAYSVSPASIGRATTTVSQSESSSSQTAATAGVSTTTVAPHSDAAVIRRTTPAVPVTVRTAAPLVPHASIVDASGIADADLDDVDDDESCHVTVISVGDSLQLKVADRTKHLPAAPAVTAAATASFSCSSTTASQVLISSSSTPAAVDPVSSSRGAAELPGSSAVDTDFVTVTSVESAVTSSAPVATARRPTTAVTAGSERRLSSVSITTGTPSAARNQTYERLSEAFSAGTPPSTAPSSGAASSRRLSTGSSSQQPPLRSHQQPGASRHQHEHAIVQRSHSSAVPQQRPAAGALHRPPLLLRQTSDTSLDSRGAAAAESSTAERRGSTATVSRDGGRQLSLREHQVMVLRREMAYRPGIRVVLPRRTVSSALLFVELYGLLWLCGWKWKDQPALSCALHVGDSLVSVCGVKVTCQADLTRALKQLQQSPVLELIVQRLPNAMVLTITREVEGQPLGLVRESGNGEVTKVLSDGLAAGHGLPARAPAVEGRGSCSWYISEVNNRAVGLFSKGAELDARLTAVGRDISLVLLPSHLVRCIKRHLKGVRNYKQYVVQ